MKTRVRIDLSGSSIVKGLAAVAGVWVWLQVWQWVLLLVVAAFLAVGLDPFVRWLERHGVRRSVGAPLSVLGIALLIVAFTYLAGAQLVEQGRLLAGRLNEIEGDVTRRIPKGIMDLLPKGNGAGPQLGNYLAGIGRAVVSGAMSLGVALVLTVYLLLDGRRTFEWVVAFAPRASRPRVRQTASEARTAVVAYIRGNVITSVIATIATYIFLLVLHVPAALLLALLAGILDFVPVLGFVLSVIPAIVLALTVSAGAAIAVTAFYLAYHAVENYYISPKVYGNELRLSDLAVIIAFAIGAELGGVIGALIALPLAAMYPVVERLWLADWLGETVEDHARIERQDTH
jgi:predicted PurR-regulated permease PerM